MLSVIVVRPTEPRSERASSAAVLRTLAALVPAAIDSVVRDVLLLDLEGEAALDAVAHESGCVLVRAQAFEDAFAQGVARARASWICVIRAGAAPARSFAEDVAGAIGGAGLQPRSFLLRPERLGLSAFFPQLSPVVAVVTSRAQFAGKRWASFADVVRRAKPSRDLPTRVAMSA